MAFCTQCGSPVTDMDRFCAKCGAPQPAAGAGAPGTPGAPPRAEFLSGVNNRTASLLCYLPWVGWICAIVILASARFRREFDVRFDAFQGLYLFVVWLIVDWVVTPFFRFPTGPDWHFQFGGIFKLAIIVVWIFMLVKVSQGERYSLPIVGELADRSVREQV